jgi:hypothetical protein
METNIQLDLIRDGKRASAQKSDGYMITRSLGPLPPANFDICAFPVELPILVSECVC